MQKSILTIGAIMPTAFTSAPYAYADAPKIDPVTHAVTQAAGFTHTGAIVNLPAIVLIGLMSYFICPDCEHKHYIFGSGGGRRLAEELDVPLLGEIPFFAGVLDGGDRGEPIVVSDPETPSAQALFDLAGRLSGLLAGRDSARVNAALP